MPGPTRGNLRVELQSLLARRRHVVDHVEESLVPDARQWLLAKSSITVLVDPWAKVGTCWWGSRRSYLCSYRQPSCRRPLPARPQSQASTRSTGSRGPFDSAWIGASIHLPDCPAASGGSSSPSKSYPLETPMRANRQVLVHRVLDHRGLAALLSLPLAARRPGQPNSPGQTQTSSKRSSLVPNQRVRTPLAIPDASFLLQHPDERRPERPVLLAQSMRSSAKVRHAG